MVTSQSIDEDKQYRHAFLIIEAKKGQSGSSNSRHVLCAESDAQRDSWVEVLVQCVHGGFYDDQQNQSSSSLAPATDPVQTHFSTNSVGYPKQTLVPNEQRGYSRDDAGLPTHGDVQEEGNSSSGVPISTSLPSSSLLRSESQAFFVPRPHSPTGDNGSGVKGTPSQPPYPSTKPLISPPEYHQTKERDERRSVQPLRISSNMPKVSLDGRSVSPDIYTPSVDQNGKVKISTLVGGAPIPPGYMFRPSGKDKEKEPVDQLTPNNNRREKSKSKILWAFGRPNGMPLSALPLVLRRPRLMVSYLQNEIPHSFNLDPTIGYLESP